MKKLIFLLCVSMFISTINTPIKANENITILVHIKEAAECYLVTFEEENMHVNIISNNTYLPIPALNNEASMLKEVQFSANYNSLVSTLETFLNTNIDYYAAVDIPKILQLLDIDPSSYDFKTLASLSKTATKIKKRLNLKLLLNYKQYIESNIDVETLYSIYKKCTNDSLQVKYYMLTYFVSENGYIPFDRHFYPRKK